MSNWLGGIEGVLGGMADKISEVADKVVSKAKEIGAQVVSTVTSCFDIANEVANDGTAAELKRTSEGADKHIERSRKTEKPEATTAVKVTAEEGEEDGTELQKEGQEEASKAETQILEMAQKTAGEVAQDPDKGAADITKSVISSFKGRPEQARKAMKGLLDGALNQLSQAKSGVGKIAGAIGGTASSAISALESAVGKIKEAAGRFEKDLMELDPTANRKAHSQSLERSGSEVGLDSMGDIESFTKEQMGKGFSEFSSAVEQKSNGDLNSMLSVVGLMLNVVGAALKSVRGDVGALTDAVDLAKNCRSLMQNQNVFQGQTRQVKLGAYTLKLFMKQFREQGAAAAAAKPAAAPTQKSEVKEAAPTEKAATPVTEQAGSSEKAPAFSGWEASVKENGTALSKDGKSFSTVQQGVSNTSGFTVPKEKIAIINAANKEMRTANTLGVNKELAGKFSSDSWTSSKAGNSSLQTGQTTIGKTVGDDQNTAGYLAQCLGPNGNTQNGGDGSYVKDGKLDSDRVRQEMSAMYDNMFAECAKNGVEGVQVPLISGDLFAPQGNKEEWNAINKECLANSAEKALATTNIKEIQVVNLGSAHTFEGVAKKPTADLKQQSAAFRETQPSSPIHGKGIRGATSNIEAA